MTCIIDGERMGAPAWACNEHGFNHTEDYWQYHLQQMVIAEDPIKYLEGNID